MAQVDRRQHRRTRLRLRIARIEGLSPTSQDAGFWTSDVSAGGMFFHARLASNPQLGEVLCFELSVPPGEGYSSSAGKVRGCGKVTRLLATQGDLAAIALRFTRPLALDF